MIRNPVKLKFFPSDLGHSEEEIEVRQVFADPIARTFWLAIKQGHITDQHFVAGCFDVAAIIRKRGVPKNADKLQLFMCMANRHGMGMGVFASDRFCAELFPYVTGAKVLEYSTPDTP